MRMFTNYHNMSEHAPRRRCRGWVRALFLIALLGIASAALVSVSGCGFKVQGPEPNLPFKTLAIQGTQEVSRDIRQLLKGKPGITILEKSTEAEVVVLVVSQSVQRSIVAFSSAGRPREIQLRMRVTYRITDRFGVELSAPQEITQTRDISVSESEALAMTSAEEFMRNDMSRDIAQQLVRRLRAVKLPTP
jgi:LPS-assembly lipoprotein